MPELWGRAVIDRPSRGSSSTSGAGFMLPPNCSHAGSYGLVTPKISASPERLMPPTPVGPIASVLGVFWHLRRPLRPQGRSGGPSLCPCRRAGGTTDVLTCVLAEATDPDGQVQHKLSPCT